ncbi:SHOCT domain-containing protein [Conexibacter stalactiti]|uniref:SHOCT domain-containing protein n=1 Tax=Conexibacter stalactiti TaxID=1940611 RepID=A0ABU4HT20_9ACTN|nr:SHOCT domain-containing protein [Conexibacter stalactiti]MDW5595822.1 SHOCT domain-containing protein [Conexibacter stalactiti]MEC5036464.1 SHOCT domain-containing protein [Conexibacter stalactiti]
MGLFDKLRRGQTPETVVGGTSVEIVGDISNVSDEQRAKLRALGIDLDQLAAGDASGIAPLFDAAFMTPPAAADDAEETLSRLERLQRLREQGVLTEAEFAEQKRRILGDG